LPIWFAFVLSVSISSLIVITGVGYILLRALGQPSITASLKSHGLRALTENG
jgi:hypothetical protein